MKTSSKALGMILAALGIAGFGVSPLAAQRIRVDLTQDAGMATVQPVIENEAADSLACSYTITTTRTSITGNTSTSRQGSSAVVAPSSEQRGGTSTFNAAEGDEVTILAELYADNGELIDRQELTRKL